MAAVPLVAMSAACGNGTNATGMGFYESCDGNPADKATFGFSWQLSGHFQGAYHDPAGSTAPNCRPVKLQGDGTVPLTSTSTSGICPILHPDVPQTTVNFMKGELKYTSQDPNVPDCVLSVAGTCEPNTLTLTVCDTGHKDPSTGERVGDFIEILITSGPFAGYHNAGPVEGGNITVHDSTGAVLAL